MALDDDTECLVRDDDEWCAAIGICAVAGENGDVVGVVVDLYLGLGVRVRGVAKTNGLVAERAMSGSGGGIGVVVAEGVALHSLRGRRGGGTVWVDPKIRGARVEEDSDELAGRTNLN